MICIYKKTSAHDIKYEWVRNKILLRRYFIKERALEHARFVRSDDNVGHIINEQCLNNKKDLSMTIKLPMACILSV